MTVGIKIAEQLRVDSRLYSVKTFFSSSFQNFGELSFADFAHAFPRYQVYGGVKGKRELKVN